MCIYSKPLQQKRRCFFQITESTKHNYRQNKKYTAAGSVSGSVQVCETTDCCVGYYRIINGTPKADILGKKPVCLGKYVECIVGDWKQQQQQQHIFSTLAKKNLMIDKLV